MNFNPLVCLSRQPGEVIGAWGNAKGSISKEVWGKDAYLILVYSGWCFNGRPNLFDLCFADDILIFTVGSWIHL